MNPRDPLSAIRYPQEIGEPTDARVPGVWRIADRGSRIAGLK